MAGMEEVMGQILQNPQAMQQIFSLAQSLNLGQGAAPSAGATAPSPVPAPAMPRPNPPSQAMDADGMFRGILELAGQSSQRGPQLALFEALKPFVTPERAKQIDQAILVARIAQMAAGAFQRMAPGPGKGGPGHV